MDVAAADVWLPLVAAADLGTNSAINRAKSQRHYSWLGTLTGVGVSIADVEMAVLAVKNCIDSVADSVLLSSAISIFDIIGDANEHGLAESPSRVVSTGRARQLSSPCASNGSMVMRGGRGSHGLYRIVTKTNVMVSRTVALGGECAAILSPGKVVMVIRLARCRGRLRGLIAEPSGWISLLNTKTGIHFAKAEMPPEDEEPLTRLEGLNTPIGGELTTLSGDAQTGAQSQTPLAPHGAGDECAAEDLFGEVERGEVDIARGLSGFTVDLLANGWETGTGCCTNQLAHSSVRTSASTPSDDSSYVTASVDSGAVGVSGGQTTGTTDLVMSELQLPHLLSRGARRPDQSCKSSMRASLDCSFGTAFAAEAWLEVTAPTSVQASAVEQDLLEEDAWMLFDCSKAQYFDISGEDRNAQQFDIADNDGDYHWGA